MLISRWIITVAFGLALATSGQAQDQTESTNREAGQQDQPTYEPPLPFPVEIVEAQAEAEARKRREEEARKREIADLDAQQGMNAATQSIESATRDMRDYALYSTFLVGIGTVLAFAAFVLSLLSNRSARAAVKVMRDEQRPWVHVEIDEITEYAIQHQDRGREDFATGIYFKVPFKIRNTGTSPAHNVSVYIAAHSIESAYEDVEHFKFCEAPIFINQRGSLAPNTTISDEEGVTRKLTVAHEGPTDGLFCFLVAIVSYSTSQQSELPDARTIQNFRLISDIEGNRTATVSFEKTRAKIGTFVVGGMGGGTMT